MQGIWSGLRRATAGRSCTISAGVLNNANAAHAEDAMRFRVEAVAHELRNPGTDPSRCIMLA